MVHSADLRVAAVEQEPFFRKVVRAGEPFAARALFAGERIDVRNIQPRLGEHPVVTTVREGGLAAVFRYGAVVFFGVPEAGQHRFLNLLAPGIEGRFEKPERERIDIRVDAGRRDGVYEGVLSLEEASAERLQVVAEVLAKSVVLAHYEQSVSAVFEDIEPLARDLHTRGRIGRRGRQLISQIGDILLIQHRMVGRVEVLDKPELLWERAELERLYARMESEFEIRDRHLALERKLGVISDTSETLLEMLQTRQGLRVEWYIVILILVDICLGLYEKF